MLGVARSRPTVCRLGRERRARLRAATVAVQLVKAAKLAAVFTQRAELATGTVAQSIGVDTVDQNDTGRTAKER